MSGWISLANGLMLREDEFSWQGSTAADTRFYLRRDKYDPKKITDLLFGSLENSGISKIFIEFIKQTGGLGAGQITFKAIARLDDSFDEVVARYDRVKEIFSISADALNIEISDSFLDKSGCEYSAIFIILSK
ncbi:hypothetical protein [Poseidonocella sp. HB161398]|uniref:hypothetical protein n=1 Tax=Poseidonocella sp. HB161398 TaxID=2320855 RepID=UPI001108A52E|nr:hypothetical protein [Poseidonocella sp. HB161398]